MRMPLLWVEGYLISMTTDKLIEWLLAVTQEVGVSGDGRAMHQHADSLQTLNCVQKYKKIFPLLAYMCIMISNLGNDVQYSPTLDKL